MGKDRGKAGGGVGGLFKGFGAMIDGIHRGHDSEEHLGRADVGRGLVAADVLLARAEGETHGRVAVDILRHADEPAGHLPLELIPGGEKTGMRAAEAHRYTEADRKSTRLNSSHQIIS